MLVVLVTLVVLVVLSCREEVQSGRLVPVVAACQ